MDASPLNRLPAELRNYIYGLAVRSSTDIQIVNSSITPIALTATCRHIRADTLAMFYSGNTFRVLDFGLPFNFLWRPRIDRLNKWLETIGEVNASNIRTISLDYGEILAEADEAYDQRWKRFLRHFEEDVPQLSKENVRVKFAWLNCTAVNELECSSWIYTWENAKDGWCKVIGPKLENRRLVMINGEIADKD